MRRRDLLAASGLAFSGVGGCLARSGGTSSTTRSPTPNSPDEPTTGEPTTRPTPSGACGPAAVPLSGTFTDDRGDERACFEGASAGLVVENEREELISVAVEVEGEDGTVLEVSDDLQPGDRLLERGVLPAQEEHTAHVSLDGDVVASGRWPTPSCYRHGIAVVPGSVEFGFVPPLEGPGDTQHDCYAGDDASLRVYNGEESQSVEIRVLDHCAESVREEALDLEPGAVGRVEDALVAGGNYDVTIDVADGESATYEFREDCWGVTASIDEDGAVTIRQIYVD